MLSMSVVRETVRRYVEAAGKPVGRVTVSLPAGPWAELRRMAALTDVTPTTLAGALLEAAIADAAVLLPKED